MQFQVPQFLDVEDKIVGPFTLKQFLYIVGSVGLAYMAWRFLWGGIGHILALASLALGGALAYYRPNKKPFVYMVESAFNYINSSRRYIWQRKKQEKMETHLDLGNFQTTTHTGGLPMSGSGQSKLNDLTWGIDVNAASAVPGDTRSDALML